MSNTKPTQKMPYLLKYTLLTLGLLIAPQINATQLPVPESLRSGKFKYIMEKLKKQDQATASLETEIKKWGKEQGKYIETRFKRHGQECKAIFKRNEQECKAIFKAFRDKQIEEQKKRNEERKAIVVRKRRLKRQKIYFSFLAVATGFIFAGYFCYCHRKVLRKVIKKSKFFMYIRTITL